MLDLVSAFHVFCKLVNIISGQPFQFSFNLSPLRSLCRDARGGGEVINSASLCHMASASNCTTTRLASCQNAQALQKMQVRVQPPYSHQGLIENYWESDFDVGFSWLFELFVGLHWKTRHRNWLPSIEKEKVHFLILYCTLERASKLTFHMGPTS